MHVRAVNFSPGLLPLCRIDGYCVWGFKTPVFNSISTGTYPVKIKERAGTGAAATISHAVPARPAGPQMDSCIRTGMPLWKGVEILFAALQEGRLPILS